MKRAERGEVDEPRGMFVSRSRRVEYEEFLEADRVIAQLTSGVSKYVVAQPSKPDSNLSPNAKILADAYEAFKAFYELSIRVDLAMKAKEGEMSLIEKAVLLKKTAVVIRYLGGEVAKV